MFLQKLLVLILAVSLCRTELIQLERKDTIYCITNSLESATYVYPPIIQNVKNTAVLLEDDTVWTTWSLVNSKQVVIPSVQDKRWEDFETQYVDSVHFDSIRSLSYSVFGSGLSITTRDPITPVRRRRDVDRNWNSGSTYPTYKNTSFQVDLKTSSTTYWKIHDYDLRWASEISNSSTILTIPRLGLACLAIYVHLCPHCILQVRVGPNEYTFHGVSEDQWKWQHQELNVGEGTVVTFDRKTDNGRSDGEWAVDIRKCRNRIQTQKSIYYVDFYQSVQSNESRSCNTLTSDNERNIFGCKVGTLGKKCDLHCKDILGEDKKYCKQYKICPTNSECLCAWGYKGPTCDAECPRGKWGLSCRENCKNCNTCHGVTGACTG